MERKRERKNEEEEENPTDPVTEPPMKSLAVRIPHVRDIIEPKPLSDDGKYCKIITWNVAGLRGTLKNSPNILLNLATKHNADIICLQETKLQSNHVHEFADILPNYHSYWTCSEAKKGYSGNAIFVKKSIPIEASTDTIKGVSTVYSQPKKSKQMTLASWTKPMTTADQTSSNTAIDKNEHLSISNIKYELDDARFCGEGRTITIDFGMFTIVACYVPNSGENLKRLDYRINEWDPYMRDYLCKLRESKPVIFIGDLNVGHLDLDIHNPTAKHIVKQSGLTPEERNSFSSLLAAGFRDAFRFLYPEARGMFTYWSQRTFARPINHGIRLDYFICSNDLFGVSDANASSGNESAGSEVMTTEITTGISESIENFGKKVKRVKKMKEVQVVHEPRLLVATQHSSEAFPHIHDSYILHDDTVGVSDHCPAILVVRLA